MPKIKKKLPRKITSKVKLQKQKKEPAWKGPEVDGVTQSLLSRFLVCKERFRILTIEGFKVEEQFSPAIHYGNMWHSCEEALAAKRDWKQDLKVYCTNLCKVYPTESNQVDKWYNVALKQFPIYAEYWEKHPDVKDRIPLLQEETFCVPYELPSGRVVKLRGKFDSVDLIGKGRYAKVYLQENKSKGTINEEAIVRQLTFDLQTMIYLIALRICLQEENELWNEEVHLPSPEILGSIPVPKGVTWPLQIGGVRYNVIRRPLSGGKGSIRQHKPTKSNPEGESKEEFYDRLQQYFIDEPEDWFMRWTVDVTHSDIQLFKDQFLDPCLEHLCLWYDYQTGAFKQSGNFLHYRLPYGIYNSVMEGRGSDVEEYLLSGSTVGLNKVDSLFPELE